MEVPSKEDTEMAHKTHQKALAVISRERNADEATARRSLSMRATDGNRARRRRPGGTGTLPPRRRDPDRCGHSGKLAGGSAKRHGEAQSPLFGHVPPSGEDTRPRKLVNEQPQRHDSQ